MGHGLPYNFMWGIQRVSKEEQAMDQARLADLYEQMLRVMLWEQKQLRLIDEGKVSGFYHSGRGQEAVPVGGCAALREDDYLLYAHRGCGYMIAKGLSMSKLFGDFLANTEGPRGGSERASCTSPGRISASSARAEL